MRQGRQREAEVQPTVRVSLPDRVQGAVAPGVAQAAHPQAGVRCE